MVLTINLVPNKTIPKQIVDYMAAKYLALLLASLALASALPQLWPLPARYSLNASALPYPLSPCDIDYQISSPLAALVNSTINHYLEDVFRCSARGSSNVTLRVVTLGRELNFPLQTVQQSYSLIARDSGRWELQSQQFTGFLRGIQTFSQLFESTAAGSHFVQGLPILIDDQPEFKWRGLMIDTSRHYLELTFIKKIVRSLLYNKLNVLHWHIIDQDSFPLQLDSVPELSEFGSVAGTYSLPDIRKQVIEYARNMGVRVVFEIDTPAHTHSWGRSEKYREMVVRCNSVYTGQFDPTLDLTYQVVTKVMTEINSYSQDPYLHFGGDQTSDSCWDLKPSIKTWMSRNNLTTYNELSSMYRRKQKSIFRNISKSKRAIYWANEVIDLPLEQDDVLQWWGLSKNLGRLKNRTNEVILSSYDIGYLDVGFGNRNGANYGSYINWRNIYAFNPHLEGVRVIGGEVCMWAELCDQRTFQQKVWIRSSVLAERLWNSEVQGVKGVAERLVAHGRRLRQRGFKTSPVTVQLCEENAEICFD